MKKLSKIKLKNEVAMTDNEMKFIIGGYEAPDGKKPCDDKKEGDPCDYYREGIHFYGVCRYTGWLYAFICDAR